MASDELAVDTEFAGKVLIFDVQMRRPK